MENFDKFWNDLLIKLKTPKNITNWTAKNELLGEDFTAEATSDNIIICATREGSTMNARRKDFELVYKDWEGYKSETVSRKEFGESFVTKYTISIIHQFQEQYVKS